MIYPTRLGMAAGAMVMKACNVPEPVAQLWCVRGFRYNPGPFVVEDEDVLDWFDDEDEMLLPVCQATNHLEILTSFLTLTSISFANCSRCFPSAFQN